MCTISSVVLRFISNCKILLENPLGTVHKGRQQKEEFLKPPSPFSQRVSTVSDPPLKNPSKLKKIFHQRGDLSPNSPSGYIPAGIKMATNNKFFRIPTNNLKTTWPLLKIPKTTNVYLKLDPKFSAPVGVMWFTTEPLKTFPL